MTSAKGGREPLTPELRAIGGALRLLRLQAEWKQHQAAGAAGITKAMLSSYETGKSAPALPTLLAILRGLGADFCDLQRAMAALLGVEPTGIGFKATSTGQQDTSLPLPDDLVKRQREIGKAVLEIAANLGLPRL